MPCHSHNDYTRRVPLFQGLAAGCISTEADLYIPSKKHTDSSSLESDDLLVGHSRSSLRQDRTLRSLYINPLLQILTAMNTETNVSAGSQYNGIFSRDLNQSFTLLLDFKESSPVALSALFDRLQSHLNQFRAQNASDTGYLSSYSNVDQRFTSRQITIVLTGAIPFSFILDPARNQHKDVFFDAPLHNLYPYGDEPSPYNTSNSYFASTSLKKHVARPSFLSGKFSTSQIEKIGTQIRNARDLDLVPRYWGTPKWPVGSRGYVWMVLERMGVGLLNVDKVEVARRWIRGVDRWRGVSC